MKKLICRLTNPVRNEKGQGMVEYGLIIALISVAAITVLVLFGPALIKLFNSALAGLA